MFVLALFVSTSLPLLPFVFAAPFTPFPAAFGSGLGCCKFCDPLGVPTNLSQGVTVEMGGRGWRGVRVVYELRDAPDGTTVSPGDKWPFRE